MIWIREATLDDTPALIAMGCQFVAETSYQGRIAANPEQMATLIQRLLTEDAGALFVADKDGDVVGMIGLYAYPHLISGERFASELFWWTTPEHRGHGLRLLRRAEQWGREQGATQLQMIAPSEDVERLYELLRFQKVETHYQRAL